MNFAKPLASRDMQDKKAVYHGRTKANLREIQNPYGARYGTTPVPKYHIASKVHLVSISTTVIFINNIFQGVSADAAYQLIHDELNLGTCLVLRTYTFL